MVSIMKRMNCLFLTLSVTLITHTYAGENWDHYPSYQEILKGNSRPGRNGLKKVLDVVKKAKRKGLWGRECRREVSDYLQDFSIWKDLTPEERINRLGLISRVIVKEKKLRGAEALCQDFLNSSRSEYIVNQEAFKKELREFISFKNIENSKKAHTFSHYHGLFHDLENIHGKFISRLKEINLLESLRDDKKDLFFKHFTAAIANQSQSKIVNKAFWNKSFKIGRYVYFSSQKSIDEGEEAILKSLTPVLVEALTYAYTKIGNVKIVNRRTPREEVERINNNNIHRFCYKQLTERVQKNEISFSAPFQDFLKKQSKKGLLEYKALSSLYDQNIVHPKMKAETLQCIIGVENRGGTYRPELLTMSYCGHRKISNAIGLVQYIRGSFYAHKTCNGMASQDFCKHMTYINPLYNIPNTDDVEKNKKIATKLWEGLFDDAVMQLESTFNHLNFLMKYFSNSSVNDRLSIQSYNGDEKCKKSERGNKNCTPIMVYYEQRHRKCVKCLQNVSENEQYKCFSYSND